MATTKINLKHSTNFLDHLILNLLCVFGLLLQGLLFLLIALCLVLNTLLKILGVLFSFVFDAICFFPKKTISYFPRLEKFLAYCYNVNNIANIRVKQVKLEVLGADFIAIHYKMVRIFGIILIARFFLISPNTIPVFLLVYNCIQFTVSCICLGLLFWSYYILFVHREKLVVRNSPVDPIVTGTIVSKVSAGFELCTLCIGSLVSLDSAYTTAFPGEKGPLQLLGERFANVTGYPKEFYNRQQMAKQLAQMEQDKLVMRQQHRALRDLANQAKREQWAVKAAEQAIKNEELVKTQLVSLQKAKLAAKTWVSHGSLNGGFAASGVSN
jgi:hypothetical protein